MVAKVEASKGLMDKLGVKQSSRVVVLGVRDEVFWKHLKDLGAEALAHNSSHVAFFVLAIIGGTEVPRSNHTADASSKLCAKVIGS